MSRWIIAVLLSLLAVPATAADGMSAAEVNKLARPLMIYGCRAAMQQEKLPQTASVMAAMEDYCGCAYDTMTEGMSGDEIMLRFAQLGTSKKAAESDPWLASAAETCLPRLLGNDTVIRADNLVIRDLVVGGCIQGWNSNSPEDEASRRLMQNLKAEDLCQCSFERGVVGRQMEDFHKLFLKDEQAGKAITDAMTASLLGCMADQIR